MRRRCTDMLEFNRIKRLPPYVFAIVNNLKMDARRRGEDIIDLGMGNPDGATPKHIVDKLIEASRKPKNHRYSASKGITQLRMAICEWYRNRYDVDLDPESETCVTIGSKEGLSHLVLATVVPGDVVMTPTPAYPIHPYSVIIAGGEVRTIPIGPGIDFFHEMEKAYKTTWPKAKIMVLHDLAYADLVFDDYKAPSFLQVPGAKDIGVEFFSLTKSYNMAGWRVGFCVGNKEIVGALIKIKSYLDYGMFQPIQIASVIALRGPQECVEDMRRVYERRRNVLVKGLKEAGWTIEPPKATMFAWAEIPDKFKKMGSLDFCKLLIKEAGVAISPGIGFGEGGDDYVRFALVENEHRIRQATKGIKRVLNR